MAKADLAILLPIALALLVALVPRSSFSAKWTTAGVLLALSLLVFVVLGLALENWQNACNHEGDQQAYDRRSWWNS